jgi:hypothetical protein
MSRNKAEHRSAAAHEYSFATPLVLLSLISE